MKNKTINEIMKEVQLELFVGIIPKKLENIDDYRKKILLDGGTPYDVLSFDCDITGTCNYKFIRGYNQCISDIKRNIKRKTRYLNNET